MATKEMKVAMQNEETEAQVQEENGFNPNEPLFEGGPTQGQIEQWKQAYGQVYLTEVDDEDIYIWRVLTRKEFKDIMKLEQADAMYREERVCEKCILYPEGYNFMDMSNGKAGVPTVLSEQIMERSGFAAKTGPIML